MQTNNQTTMYVKKNKVDILFLLYWGVLVFWQNINPGQTGTMADTLIKLFLLVTLVIYYFMHVKISSQNLLLFVLYAVNMLCSLFIEFSFSLRILLTYLYPVLIVFLTLVLGGNYQITKSQLIRFSNGIISIVLYAALYACIIMPDKFIQAFHLSTAYGNELTSFFISSHEYALYLLGGIISCVICLELNNFLSKPKKLFYVACIGLFLLNLILTFSRTFLIGTLCVFIINAILNRKSKLAKLTWIGIICAIALIAFVPQIRNFVFNLVFKGNNLADRDDLTALTIRTFEKGSVMEKIWGQGVTKTQALFKLETSHVSVHNAYLQTMLFFGVANLIPFIGFLLSCLRQSLKTIKMNVFVSVLCVSLNIACIVVMFFNTATVFNSTIDSFFLTMVTIVVPKYVINAVKKGTFDDMKGVA